MITVLLDGKRLEIDEGSRLRDIFPLRDPECCVAIIRPGTRESEETQSVRLTTTAGEIVVELTGIGRDLFGSPETRMPFLLHWHDRYAAAFGPFQSGITPARSPYLFERGDVILGCGGYDPKRSYLIFSRSRHTADLGTAADGGVIGRVVSGRGVLDRWETGDRITEQAPVISWADVSRSFTTKDDDLVVDDGMEIVTSMHIVAFGYSPEKIETDAAESVEHMLLALKDGHFTVGRASSTHIRDERRRETEVVEEVNLPRREGTVTVRTRGSSTGDVYVYTQDIPRSSSHTVTGQITHGLEIARLAKDQDVFCISVDPSRFDLIGMPLEEALAVAGSRGIEAEVDAKESNRVVVDQVPRTTLECLAAGRVSITTIPLERVMDVTLDDEKAPQSCDIFRRLTGLHLHDVGRIPFFFNFEDVYLFKPSIPKGVKIIPENTPENIVPPAALAITNDSRKGSGLVGVRTIENNEFGPTSEPFEGTNIIGKVLYPEKLKLLQENEVVFIMEMRS